jgi:uncharacterized protein (TIGR02284 family)
MVRFSLSALTLAAGKTLIFAFNARIAAGAMEKSEVISTLNDLLKTTRDSEIGLCASAEQVGSDALMSVFQIAARDRGRDVGELNAHIRALDGAPSNSGTLSGSLHRAWATFRSSVAAMDDYTVLKECERAEGAVRSAYESALKKTCRQTCGPSSSASIRASRKMATAYAIFGFPDAPHIKY